MAETDVQRERAVDAGGATRHTTSRRWRGTARAVGAWVTTALAVLLVWVTLTGPDPGGTLGLAAFARIPLEGVLLVGLVLLLPPRARGWTAILLGLALALLTIVRMTNAAFLASLGRPFDPLTDWSYFGAAVNLLGDSIGQSTARLALAGVVVLCVALLVLVPLALRRVGRVVNRHRVGSIRAVVALGLVWLLCAALGLQLAPGTTVASTGAVRAAYGEVGLVRAAVEDGRAFTTASAVDPFTATPGDELLTGLRGKDVLLVFVESYGRVAIEGSAERDLVDPVLDAGTTQLGRAGFSARSAFLTSPTFGGFSWLAHSTLQSGLWVNSGQRYTDVVSSDRFTLSQAFRRAGWRTVGDVPSNVYPWPVGTSFYHYDQLYDSRDVGYVGPVFGYARMPDQYALAALHRAELAKPDHRPVMAEIDLASSHAPWAPLPHLVDWAALGDGSVFDPMPAQSPSWRYVWSDPSRVRAAYAQSIAYALSAVISFIQTHPDPNLVVVMLGDHQPASIVSGQGASHDVPVTVIAHDPATLDRISPWGWQDGMRPGTGAPVWRMDTFRDRFLTAFGSQPSHPTQPSHPLPVRCITACSGVR
ncbi:sulfatase [Intrasporangium oryzae NRRL B-24470]|uniref:Sulfatase n=1 Tax=Intrasporangium oryzae NRRL B-24470 TaxID=1386089 RepID=W9G8T4_9MICO|nr:hypothetical protein [Intrasporangium oryzae]EWT02586.1 sulfatase [Intrasporangium oryzae NRRL B-24470]